jgi:hypothetical protein
MQPLCRLIAISYLIAALFPVAASAADAQKVTVATASVAGSAKAGLRAGASGSAAPASGAAAKTSRDLEAFFVSAAGNAVLDPMNSVWTGVPPCKG